MHAFSIRLPSKVMCRLENQRRQDRACREFLRIALSIEIFRRSSDAPPEKDRHRTPKWFAFPAVTRPSQSGREFETGAERRIAQRRGLPGVPAPAVGSRFAVRATRYRAKHRAVRA